MGRLELNRMLGCLLRRPSHLCASCCMCMATLDDQDGSIERKALIMSNSDDMVKLKEMYEGSKTLAFHLEPKTVVLRVSMHCQGCAKQVAKRISRIAGVTSFEMDLDSKKVVVVGDDITPFEVLECISKVKSAELWVDEEPEIVSISSILS